MAGLETPERSQCLGAFLGTITEVKQVPGPQGRQLLSVTVEDRHKSLRALFARSPPGDPFPDEGSGAVRLLFITPSSSTSEPVKGYRLEPLDRLDSLGHLPGSRLVRPGLVDETEDWVRSCPLPLLRQFVWKVLGRPAIGIPFFRVRASQDHHHAYPGGLAEHSLSVARLTLQALPDLDEREAWLCGTAGLMHDIGKIRCFDDKRKTTAGFVLNHEHWTLELLANALEWLDSQWPDGALAMRYLLSANPIAANHRPLLPGLMAITYADRMDSALDVRKRVFLDQPQWQHFAKTRGFGPPSRFWLPGNVSP